MLFTKPKRDSSEFNSVCKDHVTLVVSGDVAICSVSTSNETLRIIVNIVSSSIWVTHKQTRSQSLLVGYTYVYAKVKTITIKSFLLT